MEYGYDWFPGTREGRLAMARTWLAVITEKQAEWNINLSVTGLADLIAEAEKRLELSMSVETNKVINARCRETFKKLETLMRFIKSRDFLSPPLTDPDFVSLGLKPRDHTRTPVNKPLMPPEADIIYTGKHLIELKNIRPVGGSPKEDKRAYYGVSIRAGILNASDRNPRYHITAPPKSGDDIPHAVFTRSKKYLFDFEGESGKTVYFCLRYENKKAGEYGGGPYGQIIDAVIP